MRQRNAPLALLLILGGLIAGLDSASAKTEKPLSPDGRLNLSVAQGFLQSGDFAKANFHAERALASDPGSAQVHAVMAMVHAVSGEDKKAEKEFARALKIAPNEGSILNSHASWLCEHGQFAQADEEFARALLDGRYVSPLQAMSNAGSCAHKAGQWQKAEGYFRRVLAASPQNRHALLLMADVELRQHKIMEAQAFVQRLDSLGDDIATLVLAARIEDAANNPANAARYRQRLKEVFPNYVPTGEGARSP
jgi:type IV pilus assembly protein PilF